MKAINQFDAATGSGDVRQNEVHPTLRETNDRAK